MTQGADLLRLLEPAVRPVAQPASANPPGKATFEASRFEELLADAQLAHDPSQPQETNLTPSDPTEKPTPSFDPLAALADLGQIENPSVRSLM
jgi:hypothetical protein